MAPSCRSRVGLSLREREGGRAADFDAGLGGIGENWVGSVVHDRKADTLGVTVPKKLATVKTLGVGWWKEHSNSQRRGQSR
jgi:hypothetical protein